MFNKSLLLILSVMMLFGCSEDEIIGTGLDGLKPPERISILKPKPEAANQEPVSALTASAVFSDSDTDYSSDETITYTKNELQKLLEEQNKLLCVLDKINLDTMVNKGPYKAIVNENLCRGDKNFNLKPLNIVITAISERENNDSPQSIKAWLAYPTRDINNRIKNPEFNIVEGLIRGSVSSDRPFGSVSLSYKRIVKSDGLSNNMILRGYGAIQTHASDETESQFRAIDIVSNFNPATIDSFSRSVNLLVDIDKREYGAVLQKSEMITVNGRQSTYTGGLYNDDYLIQGSKQIDPIPSQCYSRNQFDSFVRDYGIYHQQDATFRNRYVAAGDRLTLNTRFEFRYNEQYGYVSHSNFYTPDESLADGDIVYEAFGDDAYNIHISPGRLSAITVSNIPLSEIESVILVYQGIHPNPLLENHRLWLVRVINNEFQIVSAMHNEVNGYSFTESLDHDENPLTDDIPVKAVIIDTNSSPMFTNLGLSARRESYYFQFRANISPEQRTITKYMDQSVILSSDPFLAGGPVTLYCFTNCPKGGITQELVDNATDTGDLYHAYSSVAKIPHKYSVLADNYKTVLIDDSNGGIVDVSGLTISTSSAVDPTQLLQNRFYTEPVNKGAREAGKFYVWNSHSKRNNHLVTLVNASGNALVADPYIYLPYIHQAVNERFNLAPATSPYQGRFFQFNMDGLPGKIDEQGDYRPLFSLKDGTQITAGEGNFVIKARHIIQPQKIVPLDQCAQLDFASLFNNEKLNSHLSIDDIALSELTLEDRPFVSGPPLSVDGR